MSGKLCCGRGAKSPKVRSNGAVIFSGDKPPIQGRCSVCGGRGGYSKKWNNGTRQRVFICTEQGHVLKP